MGVAHRQSPFGTPKDLPGPTTDQREPTAPTQRRAVTAPTPDGPVPETRRESPALRRAATRARQKSRGWLIAVASVVAGVALASCLTGTWLVLADDDLAEAPGSSEPTDASAGPPPPATRDDSPALTTEELFDSGVVGSEYDVLGSEELEDCAAAVTEDLADVVADGDCSQVVRATVASADGEYAATVGVANLADDTAAMTVREAIESGEGGFTAFRVDDAGRELGLSPTILGYNTYGHYVLYAVIGRVDGDTPSSDDAAVATIVADLVDTHLMERLTERG